MIITAFVVGAALGAGAILLFLIFCMSIDKGEDDETMQYISRLKAEVRDAQNECQWLHDQLDQALLENAKLMEVDVDG